MINQVIYIICMEFVTIVAVHKEDIIQHFIRNANKKWYHFNDTMVNEVSNLAKLKGPQAYCFFYRKQK